MPLFDRGAKTNLAPSPPSTMIFVLSALTASYLGLAVYFAIEHAILDRGGAVWLVAASALAILGLASQLSWSGGIAVIMTVSFVAQLAWAGWVDPQPLSDLGVFWIDARSVAADIRDGDWSEALARIHRSPQPSATVLYGLSAFVFGENLSTLRALTAAIWTVQTWLVWRVASEVSELRGRAFACALVFGLSPTLVIFGGLPSVEALYGLFALGALYMMLSHRRRGLGLSALYAGALGGLAFLARPSGMAYLVGLIAVLAIGLASAMDWRQRERMAGAAALCLLGFGLAVAPQATLNYRMEGTATISPGAAIGYQLLVGTDRGGVAETGALSTAAASTAASGLPIRESDKLWREVALERISADPTGFLVFALTTKMSRLWASEEEMLTWSFNKPSAERSPVLDSAFGRLAPDVVGGAALALIVAAAAGALRLVLRWGAVRDPTRWVLFHAAFLALAVAFMLGEVGARQQLAFAPLLALLAPLPFARLPGVATDAREEETAAEAAPPPRPSAGASAAAAAAQTPEKPAAEMTAAEKLAHRLRSMSKPPRPDEEDEAAEGGPAASADDGRV